MSAPDTRFPILSYNVDGTLDTRPPSPPPSSNSNSNNTSSNNGAGGNIDGGAPTPAPGTPLPEPTSTANNRGGIWSFIFMTIWLFMLTYGGGDDVLARNQYRDSLRSLKAQQGNFSAWVWGGGNSANEGNGTEGLNFTLPERDETSWNLARAVMGFGVPLNPAHASYYANITGFVHGPVQMYNLTTFNSSSSTSTSLSDPPAGSELPFSLIPSGVPTPIWAPLASSFISPLNSTDALLRIGSWNWSAPAELALRVLEKRPVVPHGADAEAWLDIVGAGELERLDERVWADVSLMHGRVELTDSVTGEELGFDLEAVHFLENGTIYGFAEPDGHVDVRELPSLVPPQFLNATAQAIDVELLARISRLQEMLDSGNVDIDTQITEEPPKTTCPFILYAQLVPTSVPLHLMEELEGEMENPTGISTVARPLLLVNAVLMSKKCGILLEVREAEGLKSQRFWRKVTTYSAVAALVYLALLWLFIRQTEASQTPVGISRVSRWTFLTQAAADSISFVGHITFGILADGRPSLSLVAPAFLASVLLVYEAQFSVLIHQIQQPEDAIPTPRPAPAPEQAVAPTITPPMAPSAVAPASAVGVTGIQAAATPRPQIQPVNPNSPRFFSRVWQQLRESPQARFWVIMILALGLFVRVLVSPQLALLTVAAVYGNIWFPQIVRSARRGTASGLRAEYLIGTTACRAFFALYLFACPNNVLGVDSSPWILVLITFVFLQVGIVLLQDYFGPSFFLPRSYTPAPKYDYHPYIPPPDTEAPEKGALGDCAICMDAITISPLLPTSNLRRRSTSVAEKEESAPMTGARRILDRMQPAASTTSRLGGSVSGAAARKSYALAPCHHLFHTACLERWLAIKNICPQCRRPLPPL